MLPSDITQHLLGLPPSFRLVRLEIPASPALPLVLVLTSEAAAVSCPEFLFLSHQPHSRYWRTLHDLPCCRRPIVLHVQLRRFFCRNPNCPCRIFVEPIPALARKSAQCTERMPTALGGIGQTCGGRVGVRQAE